MADISVDSTLQMDQWQDKYHNEWVRSNRYKRYMGTKGNSVIHLVEDLTKKDGDDIYVQFVRRLSGSGRTGDNQMENNEESLSAYGCKITIDQIRNAVRIGKMEQKKSNIDYMEAARPGLKRWQMEHLRDQISAKFLSANVDGVTAYASCTENQKDAWLLANTDRVLFGAAKSNNGSNDHSAALLNVDSSSDVLSTGIVSLAKRIAQTADPYIEPIMVNDEEEWFVMFVPPRAFRDLRDSSAMQQALRDAWQRGKDNPLFKSGDLIWDSVIIREVPEISALSGVGNNSIDVDPCFLCGALALGVAWGQRSKFVVDEFDYKNKKGVCVSEIRGVKKLITNDVQTGMVTVYVSGVADT